MQCTQLPLLVAFEMCYGDLVNGRIEGRRAEWWFTSCSGHYYLIRYLDILSDVTCVWLVEIEVNACLFNKLLHDKQMFCCKPMLQMCASDFVLHVVFPSLLPFPSFFPSTLSFLQLFLFPHFDPMLFICRPVCRHSLTCNPCTALSYPLSFQILPMESLPWCR